MPIHNPGQKFRQSRLLSRRKGKRDLTATLSLTAMVDMFTVLVIFLLQNFAPESQFLDFADRVELPKASQIKELQPAVVVTISENDVKVNRDIVVTRQLVEGQSEWMIGPLFNSVAAALQVAKQDYEQNLQQKLKEIVQTARNEEAQGLISWNKVTLRADKGTSFLTVKKVLYTLTEAGAGEINFAVIKEPKSPQ